MSLVNIRWAWDPWTSQIGPCLWAGGHMQAQGCLYYFQIMEFVFM